MATLKQQALEQAGGVCGWPYCKQAGQFLTGVVWRLAGAAGWGYFIA